jgi:hypothetical protein
VSSAARRWSEDGSRRDLIAAIALAVVCAIGVLVLRITALRVIFALPLCLLLPGFLIREALFGELQLEPGSRLMLIPALSFIALILSSLLINEFPGGIQAGTWVGWLLFIEILAALVAARRRGAQTGHRPTGMYRQIRLRRVDGLVLGLAILIAVGAYVASRLPLSAKNVVGYETLTLLPKSDSAVTLTARSGREHTYRYVLNLDVGSRRILSRSLSLAPGADYATSIGLGTSTAQRTVSATLQIIGASSPERQVDLSLPAVRRRRR